MMLRDDNDQNYVGETDYCRVCHRVRRVGLFGNNLLACGSNC